MLGKVKRLAGFFAFPVIGLVVPLLALPAVTSRFGAGAWAAVAVGQAAGAIAAAVLELGWGWNGPMRVARAASQKARGSHLVIATSARLLASTVVVPVTALVAYTVAPSFPLEAAITSIGAALLGLSTTWYFVGIGRPWTLVIVDGAPRLAGVLASTILISSGFPLLTYPTVGLLLPPLVAFATGSYVAGLRPRSFSRMTLRRAWRALRMQLRVVASRLLSTVYSAMPVILMTAVSPVQEIARYAGGDRIMRMGLSALSPVPTALQSWVGGPSSLDSRLRRAWQGVQLNAALGVVAGVVVFVLLPTVTDIVLSGTATVTYTDSALLGFCAAAVCTSRAVGGLVLVVLGAQRALLMSTLVGACVGLLAVPLLGASLGATGAFAAVALAETSVLFAQLAAAFYRRQGT